MIDLLLALLVACATCTISALWLAWDAHRTVGEMERVILAAEEMWADRYDLALLEDNIIDELAALQAEERHGRRQD